jgi:type VI secretion system protein ImpF
MAELVNQERLQPSLLDRLADDAPEEQQESRERRVLSLRKLREGVLRDLSWLLNAGNLASTVDLAPYPHVARSVVNFGMPDFAGLSASSVDVGTLEQVVRDVIVNFEPRILPGTLKVRAISNPDQMNHNTLGFDIEGELWAQPMPLQLYLKTEVDLEAGFVNILDYLGGTT